MYARLRNLVRRTAEKGCLALMIWCVLLLGGAGAGSAFGQIPCGGYDYITWPNMNCGFGPFPGTPVALNSHGHVAGYFIWCGDPQYRTFLWTGGPTTTVLPLPAGYKAMQAAAMNDLNEIVGSLRTNAGFSFRAFFRRANGEVIVLDLPPGATNAFATGVNNKSEVVGYGSGFNGDHAFVWRNSVFTMLDLPIGPNSRAHAINDNSQVTGWMGQMQSSVGFLWSRGSTVAFGPIPGGVSAQGLAISPSGYVGGIGLTSFGTQTVVRGFMLQRGKMTDIGTLPGYSDTWIRGVNDATAVGTNYDVITNLPTATFVWSDGQMKQLSDLVPIPSIIIDEVGAITHDGRIVCWGYGVAGPPIGLILTPVFTRVGDATSDCRVNVNDLLLVINEWGKTKSPADVNNDGIVDSDDLSVVIENWTS